MKDIYLAGGCFWGLEKLMRSIPGIIDATSGYANGRTELIPNYELVCTGCTGYKETVRVVYEEEKVDLALILRAFFAVIDTTVKNRQGNDIGTQYQTGVYYKTKDDLEIIEKEVSAEKAKDKPFFVEVEELKCFYEAEEYHQNYLHKNPRGYCHITNGEIAEAVRLVVEGRRSISNEDMQKEGY